VEISQRSDPYLILANPLCCPRGEGRGMQFDQLKRREFITLLSSAALEVACPRAGRTESSELPAVGFLHVGNERPRHP